MPMGSFKNFDECLSHYASKGIKKESAQKLCGKIYWSTEGKKKQRETKDELKKMDNLIHELRAELGVQEAKPQAELDWRKKQKRGAIMKPEEFDSLVKQFMEKGYSKDVAQKMAGKIYWQKADKKWKDSKKQEIDGAMEKEIADLMNGNTGITRDEAVTIVMNRMYKYMDKLRGY